MRAVHVVFLILIVTLSQLVGGTKLSPSILKLSTMGWWDCCLLLDEDTLLKRKEKELDVSIQVKSVREWVASMMNAEFIHNFDSRVVAVRGNASEPDRFVCRVTRNGQVREIVVGRYLITVTVAFDRYKRLTDKIDAEMLYHEWIPVVFQEKLLGTHDTEILELEDCPEFWFAGPTSVDPKTGSRRSPRTWPESIRCAVARDGSCVSYSVQKFPLQSDYPPPQLQFDKHSGWFRDPYNRKAK